MPTPPVLRPLTPADLDILSELIKDHLILLVDPLKLAKPAAPFTVQYLPRYHAKYLEYKLLSLLFHGVKTDQLYHYCLMNLKRSQTLNFQLENHQYYKSASVGKTNDVQMCLNSPKFELIHFWSA